MKTAEEKSDHKKNVFAYLKHFTTLSSGSLLIIAAFMEKLQHYPKYSSLIVTSIIGFLGSVVGAMIAYTIGIVDFSGEFKNKRLLNQLGGFGIFLTWLGFLTGLISFGIFILINLV